MAHEIDQTVDKQGAAMFVGNPAWHGLGHVVSEAQTSADALRIAGLDWEVERLPLRATLPDGEAVEVPNNFAIRRTDVAGGGSILGCVGGAYEPLQNREMFDWADEIIGSKLAIWETAGSLRGGRQVWGMFKLPEQFEIVNGDFLQPYVAVTSSHDGTEAVRFWPTSVRIVCANTLRWSLQGSGSLGLSLRHTEAGLKDRVQQAKDLIAGIRAAHEERAEEARFLAGVSVSDEDIEAYFEQMICLTQVKTDRSKAKAKAILEDYFFGPRNEPIAGATVWSLYNAASEWSDHGRRKADGEGRFASNIFGIGHSFKTRAYEAAVQLAHDLAV